MTPPDPFAAPAARPVRQPVDAVGDWLHMRSGFHVGRHRVEVQASHWTGVEIYRVDGEERLRKRNLGWHTSERLEVGPHLVEVVGRWYPLRPVIVDVDGVRAIDDLFPQVRRVIGPIAVASGALMAVLGVGILFDLYRWLLA